MYSMHYVDGIYFVDQYDGFTIPDTPLQLVLGNVSDIARIMFKFKVLKEFYSLSLLFSININSLLLLCIF